MLASADHEIPNQNQNVGSKGHHLQSQPVDGVSVKLVLDTEGDLGVDLDVSLVSGRRQHVQICLPQCLIRVNDNKPVQRHCKEKEKFLCNASVDAHFF